MPTTQLLDEASALVKRKQLRMRIAMVALALYVSVSLLVMIKFYNQLSDTCDQRRDARAALVTTLVTLNDQSASPSEATRAFILENLKPLHC